MTLIKTMAVAMACIGILAVAVALLPRAEQEPSTTSIRASFEPAPPVPPGELKSRGQFTVAAPEVGANGPDTLIIGDLAPLFTLPDIRTGKQVSLDGFRGKPVVLAFGSCTCTYFRRVTPELERLANAYRDDCAFALIYVQDAHPEKLAEFFVEHPKAKPLVTTAPDPKDRLAMAGLFQRGLGVRLPVLVDDLEDRTAAAYSATIARLVIVDGDGTIAFAGRRGPLHLRSGDVLYWLEMQFGAK